MVHRTLASAATTDDRRLTTELKLMVATGLLLLVTCVKTIATPDSTRATWIINPRLHSSAYFPFTGALLNRNPVFDLNVFYERKSFGFFVFQSFDLVDKHSYVNYLQSGIFGNLYVGTKLRLRGFFGYIFSQTHGFRDPESDYYAAFQFNWSVAKNFRIENTLLYYDYTINKKIANRLLLEWSHRKWRVSGYFWQRKVLNEEQSAVSGAVGLTFPIIKLSERTSLELTSTYMGYLTDYKPDFSLRDGFFLTVAVPMNVGKR